MAKYPYIVKHNGILYEAGADVPEVDEMAGGETQLPLSDSDITFEERAGQKQYTKTEIQRMSTAELQALAAEVGIEDAFGTSGNELKKKLAEHFNL